METKRLPKEQTHHSAIAHCLHCNTQLSDGRSFCCSGCKAAYNATQQMGINANTSLYSAHATRNADTGQYSLTLLVKGIHCASCIQLIENALLEQPDITTARVNMSTQRVTLSWNGTPQRADAFATIISKLGYGVKPFSTEDAKADDSQKQLLRALAVSGFAMGNLMMISVGLWSSDQQTMGMATQDFFHIISALIAIPTILYAGQPFFKSAWTVLKNRHTNMDVPISLAVILASAMSLYETLHHGEHIYFDSAVMLLFFLLIGRYLDERAKGKARESASELLSMLHGSATIIEDGAQTTIPIRDLRESMQVVVATGENIPADGIVTQGNSEIDMSLITGETIPNHVQPGDKVFAGTVNISAPIQFTVSKASDNSLLSDIVKLMEKAEQGQAHYVRLADKAASLYTPIVHSMGALTFIGWWLVMQNPWQISLLHAITVLIITCPCALGLAVPVVQVLATGKLMKKGILLKSGDALEKLATIDTAIFDKTGTLTVGRPELTSTTHSEQDMQRAASLAAHSKHPLSQAICHAYKGALLPVEKIEELPGKGLIAIINGVTIKLGSGTWCGLTNTQSHTQLQLALSAEGSEPTIFTFTDTLRTDAKQTIKAFQHADINTILLSGDRLEVVEQMAKTLDISQYHAALSPTEKCHFLETLKSKNHKVLMVGDGLNDAPSLAAADISISPSSAMDITQNTADIVFQSSKLSSIITAWQTAKAANRLVKQNFALAILYNIIAIPLAIVGMVTPLIAAIAMSSSSLIVIGNSFRLNLKKTRKKD